MPGVFIDVEVDDDIRDDAELAQKLEDACPVLTQPPSGAP